ncbi:hypothetical protein HQQ81_04120 [Microbacteriaceae bacterium VKM Ac-2854]|nr:hypothetical protein [Microbacteriaceae bacterium VKM Ac-2854]
MTALTASALTAPGLTASAPTRSVRPVLGSVSIGSRALERTATAIVHELLEVAVSDVRISLGDDAGGLAVSVETPITIEPLGSGSSGTPVLERLHEARSALVERMGALTGRRVSRVDIRVTGSRIRSTKRTLR